MSNNLFKSFKYFTLDIFTTHLNFNSPLFMIKLFVSVHAKFLRMFKAVSPITSSIEMMTTEAQRNPSSIEAIEG